MRYSSKTSRQNNR